MNIDLGIFQSFLQPLGIASPGIQLALDILTVILPLTALSALAGLPFISLTAEVLGQLRQRAFYDKGARQLAALAALLGWLFTLGGGLLVWSRLDTAARYPAVVQGYVVWYACIITATLCLSLHYTLWKTLRNWRLCHQNLAFVGGCCGAIALYAGLSLLDNECRIDQGLPAAPDMWALFVPHYPSPLWNILYYLPSLAVGLGAGLGTLWLLLRRKRDDYGRDYYNTILPWCATWARNAWVLLWLILLSFSLMDIFLTWQEGESPFLLDAAIFQALHILLWALPALLWTMAARSKTPLRHKLTLIFAQSIAMAFTVPLCLSLI
ncbi:MAG: hypothetical protein RRY29_01365 [Desulfovibrionaceae bacterium]